jgi:hypothetical protein
MSFLNSPRYLFQIQKYMKLSKFIKFCEYRSTLLRSQSFVTRLHCVVRILRQLWTKDSRRWPHFRGWTGQCGLRLLDGPQFTVARTPGFSEMQQIKRYL